MQGPRCPLCREVLSDLVAHGSFVDNAIEDGGPVSAGSQLSRPSPCTCSDRAFASHLRLTPEEDHPGDAWLAQTSAAATAEARRSVRLERRTERGTSDGHP